MTILPHTLSLIVTHKCTAACDHCCFTCSPKQNAAIPVPNLFKYIEESTAIAGLRVVVFTGGECFLLGDQLDELVGHAAKFKYIPRFVSNGYWATSEQRARKRIDKLVQRGLEEANFSTGDMHSQYVPIEHVRNGAIAAADAGLRVAIMVELFKGSQFSFSSFIEHHRFNKYVEEGRIRFVTSPWMKFQGSSSLKYNRAYVDAIASAGSSCPTVLRVLAITPSEHLVACCGLSLEYIPELHLGDLRKDSIAKILQQVPDDFIKIWIHLEGPRKVMQYAKCIDDSIDCVANDAHICETCRAVYANPKIRSVLKDNPPPFRDKLILQYSRQLLTGSAPSLFDSLSSLDVKAGEDMYYRQAKELLELAR